MFRAHDNFCLCNCFEVDIAGSLNNFDSHGFHDRTDPACWKGIYPNDD